MYAQLPIYHEPDDESEDYRYDAAGFPEFVEYLFETGKIDNTHPEYEIFRRILVEGTEPLTTVERDLLEIVVTRDWPICVLCKDRLTWSDRIFIIENDGMCSVHIDLIDLINE